MNWFFSGLHDSAAMFWETFWALGLGFGISAFVKVFVTKEQMTKTFGRAGLREVAMATGLGAASSSCSYAAVAAAKTAFKKGAALVPVLAFMFASTNLVFELGAVLWVLMGWTFVLAETVGALVLIAVMWLIVRLTLPKGLVEEARQHTEGAEEKNCCGQSEPVSCCGSSEHTLTIPASFSQKMRQRESWVLVADAFLMDLSMTWRELVAGFLIAGFAMAVVPGDWWQAVFLTSGPASLRLVENAIVGPLIAVVSFVCSVGNIPLASLLWSNGISFGGVISFIYADLIVIPLLLIYRKYYGTRGAAYITFVLFASMVLAGIIVDLLFGAFSLIPSGSRPPSPVENASFTWNYTTWLNIAAILAIGWLLCIKRRSTAVAQ